MNLLEPSSQEDIENLKQELRRQCQRATISSTDDVDLLAIDLFASLVLQNEAVIALDATKIIAEKFISSDSNEILQALNVLEECMSKCGQKFRSEVGKFRFLNELIRLVSPQYLGGRTIGVVRNKILDLLLLWTVNYPEESKIKEAYDVLISRGVQHELVKTPKIRSKSPTNDTAKHVSSKERDAMAEKLKTLLQSSNPADHKKANLLIQNMVKEKDRRIEMRIRRKIELREIVDNATVLAEMLDEWNESNGNEDALTTIKDLHTTCENLQRTLSILAGEPDDTELQDETFEAIELLTKTFEKYNVIIMKRDGKRIQDLLSDLAVTNGADGRNNGPNAAPIQGVAASDGIYMNEFHEIFSNQAKVSTAPLSTLRPLEPEQVNVLCMATSTADNGSRENTDQAWKAIKDLNNQSAANMYANMASLATTSSLLNLMGSSKESNKSAAPIDGSPGTDTSAVTKLKKLDSEMYDLVSELKSGLQKEQTRSSPDVELFLCVEANNDDAILDHIDMNKTYGDNQLPDILQPVDDATSTKCDTLEENSQKSRGNQHATKSDVSILAENSARKPLSEINVDINTILPHETLTPRIILDEKQGLKITLNFSRDRPRDDVTVLVITTTNHSSQSISNYQFDASVSRPCKLRLQPVSSSILPGVKPFRPPSEDITQILLLSNAERKPFKLVCIISYLLGDDPDPVKESLEITDLPYIHE